MSGFFGISDSILTWKKLSNHTVTNAVSLDITGLASNILYMLEGNLVIKDAAQTLRGRVNNITTATYCYDVNGTATNDVNFLYLAPASKPNYKSIIQITFGVFTNRFFMRAMTVIPENADNPRGVIIFGGNTGDITLSSFKFYGSTGNINGDLTLHKKMQL